MNAFLRAIAKWKQFCTLVVWFMSLTVYFVCSWFFVLSKFFNFNIKFVSWMTKIHCIALVLHYCKSAVIRKYKESVQKQINRYDMKCLHWMFLASMKSFKFNIIVYRILDLRGWQGGSPIQTSFIFGGRFVKDSLCWKVLKTWLKSWIFITC